MAITGNDTNETKTSIFKSKIPSRSKSPTKEKKMSLANYVSDRSDRLYSSSIAGTSKFVRKLRQTSRKPAQIKVNDEVTFLFHGQKTRGIVRYTGTTYFSAGKWCGIELNRPIGNHNGTVKGHEYFHCKEKFGIFLPLPKISKVVDKKSPKDESDMKITFRSVRTNGSKSILDFKNKPENGPSSKKLDIKYNSLSSSSKSKAKVGKNIVVSAFLTPTPIKPILLTQDSDLTDDVFSDETHRIIDDDINDDNTSHADLHFLNDKQNKELHDEIETGENITSVENITSIDDGDSGVVESEEFDECEVVPKTEIENFVSNDDQISQADSFMEESHLSKIPRRISINSRRRNSETAQTPDQEIEKKPKDDLTATLNRQIENPAKVESLTSNEQNKNIKEKPVTSIPRLQKTSFTKRQSLKLNKKISETNAKVSSPVSHLPKFRANSSSKDSIEHRRHILFSPSESAGTSTPRKSSKDTNTRKQSEGSQNEEPSIVMGNINASLQPDTNVQNPVGFQTTNVDEFQTRDVPGAVIIDKHDRNSIKESKSSPKKLRKFSDIKSSPKSTKDQHGYIGDLENQLKERNQRINQLELDIQNNNKNVSDEKSLNTELKNKLNNLSVAKNNLSTKYEKASSYINESNTRLEALSLVLQCYLKKVEDESHRLQTYINKFNEIWKSKQQLESNITEITEKLENETSRRSGLQQDIEALKVEHSNIIKDIEKNHETKIKELIEKYENEISKTSEQYKLQIVEIKETHNNEKQDLQKDIETKVEQWRQEKLQFAENWKQETDNKLLDKERSHEHQMEKIRKQHEEKISELKDNIDRLTNEQNLLKQRTSSPTQNTPNGSLKRSVSEMSNLPAELESLQVVLEMKNEEVKNLRVKQMELERKLETFYELESKCDSLTQQNQSLSESLKNKSLLERKVSVERDTYLERLEKETKKVSRLSMEKEQLMWRASNQDLSYSSPNIFFEEEENDDPPSPLRSGSFTSTPKTHANGSYKRRSMNFPISKSDYSIS